MRSQGKRIEALEKSRGQGTKVWHRVICEIGQDQDDLIANYNKSNPIPDGEDRAFIVWTLV